MTKPPTTTKREKLSFDDPEALQALIGSNNSRLKLVERTAGAEIHLRGNELTIEGDAVATGLAKAALEQLYELALAGKPLSSDDVVRAVKLLQGGSGESIGAVFGDTILAPRAGRPIAPKGAAQKKYVDLVRENDIVFSIGPAGTGKTYLAMALAVKALLDKQVRRIILTRPAVEAGESLGFLPGTLEEKIDPYLRPLFDALGDMIDLDKLQRLMADKTIEVAPLAFLRGRTLNDAFIVLDEAQNTTPAQMKMFLTRMGYGSRMVITGDPTQTDLPAGQRSGLRDSLGLIEGIRGIGMIEFGDADVVRHPLVAALIRAYDARDRATSIASEMRRPRDANADHEDTRGGDPDAPEARSTLTMVVSSPDDLVAAVSRDCRMSGYRVRRQGEGWIELEVIAQRARSPVMLVLAWPETWRDAAAFAPHLTRARAGNYGLIVVGTSEELEEAKLDTVSTDADLTALSAPVTMVQLLLALRSRADAIAMRITAATIELEHERARHENEMLISIGRSLSQLDIESLLAIILRRACELTSSDAGSVYIVEGHEEDLTRRRLRFAVSQNESRNVQSTGFTMPVTSSSIVGSCVLSGVPINVPDLYKLDEPGVGNNQWGFVHDRGFDDKYHYQGRSVLAVPMISARDEVIGVIQLINKRGKGFISLQDPSDFEHGVVPFDDVSEKYVSALASQAGIALENVLLYEEVRTLFDSFVKASVTAIESRDPTTSGHSNRVAELTVGLGKAINRTDTGSFRDMRFSNDSLKQMEYAALLHDFGKVGVREHVLVKAKKLYEHEREIILQRFQLIKRGHKISGLEKKLQYYQDASREQIVEQLTAVDSDMSSKILELDDIIKFILAANEPTVLEQGGFERIAEIAGMTYDDETGSNIPLLSHNEATCLQIKRGSLTEAERNEINTHVVHTYNFLKEIPWSRTLRDVPEIAGAHHEKLDGSGYPFGRKAPAIPVEAKMMAIADIYDALTASDRPYKKAMSAEKALDILSGDVKRGQLDAQLYDIFVGARVYLVTQRDPQPS